MSAKAGKAVNRKPSLESFTEAGSECLRNNCCSSTRYQVRYITGKKTKDIVYDCKVAMKCRLLRWCRYVLSYYNMNVSKVNIIIYIIITNKL